MPETQPSRRTPAEITTPSAERRAGKMVDTITEATERVHGTVLDLARAIASPAVLAALCDPGLDGDLSDAIGLLRNAADRIADLRTLSEQMQNGEIQPKEA